MFPITEATLSLHDIAEYWSREIRPPASSNELLGILVSAWWLGELRGDSVHSRLQLLKIMFTSKYRDDLGIVFIVGNDAGPAQVVLPDDEPLEVDVRPQIRVPSSNTESWDEAACRDAFHALAEVTKDSSINIYQEFSSINIYREFAVFLPSIKVTYEEFDTWLSSRGYSPPTFWHPRRVASERWRTKAGKSLAASESAVLKAINEIWPDGTIDHKAQVRDNRILTQLKTASQHSVSRRTIERTIQKIHFR
jgi:hypothetical protein